MQLLRFGLVAAVAAIGLARSSLGAAASDDPSLMLSTSLGSAYTYRGIARTGPSAQFGIEGIIDGWHGRLWGNQPFRDGEPGELQSSLGYSWKAMDGLIVELRGTHFWYVHHPIRGTASHSFEADLIVAWEFQNGWQAGVMPLGDIRFQSTGGELWLGRAIPLKRLGAFLHWRVFVGAVDGHRVAVGEGRPAIRDSYTYWGAEGRLPYRISAHTTVFAEADAITSSGINPAWSPLRRANGVRAWLRLGTQYEF